MYKATILAGLFAVSTTAATAAVIDFENETSVGASDAVTVAIGSTTYTNGGITFSSGDGNALQLVGSGGGLDGFVPSDSVTPTGAFGNVFLTGDFIQNSAMNLSFGLASAITFDIADIDGSGQKAEQFTFNFLNAGTVVGSVFRQAGVAPTTPGDGTITTISYSGLFDSVEITNRTVGSATGANRPNIGWGIDNISLTPENISIAPIPVPAAGLMLLSALGGMGLMRRRKRSR